MLRDTMRWQIREGWPSDRVVEEVKQDRKPRLGGPTRGDMDERT